jgi:hypothetical protein
MCEECEEAQPVYVAYFGKAGGRLWQPPGTNGLQPIADTTNELLVNSGSRVRFVCDALTETVERKTN